MAACGESTRTHTRHAGSECPGLRRDISEVREDPEFA